jgi:error-prone DNA polymerase
VAAEFSDVEANQLRRAMATFRNVGTIHHFEHLLIERMVARGYERGFAENCFQQIKGFGSYGFPESHAASFAKLVYVSSWLKRHHPAAFACALLNAQPMGFYAPAQIVRDAREHAVEVRPVDVNHSLWDSTLERRLDGALTLRLGFRQVDGLHAAEAERLIAQRGAGYASLEMLAARARLRGRPLQALADADAFGSLRLSRRDALWAARRIPADDPLPLFAAAGVDDLGCEPDARLPSQSLGEHVAADYQTLRLSLKAHPMAILRKGFNAERVSTAVALHDLKDGAFARMAGVVLVRQRPGKGNAIFITLEDETGVANVVLWASKLERFRKAVMGARLLLVEGRVQKSPEGVLHLMASHLDDRTGALASLWSGAQPPNLHLARLPLAPADEADRLSPAAGAAEDVAALLPPPLTLAPGPRLKPSLAARSGRHPRDVRVLPRSRDFH